MRIGPSLAEIITTMNKTFFYTRFFRFLGLSLLLCITSFTTVWGQGFFTPTDHAINAWDIHFEILPDGYRAKSIFPSTVESVKYFGNLHLDAKGKEIGWDSISRSYYATGTYTEKWWLPDNDLLEIGGYISYAKKVQKSTLSGIPIWDYIINPSMANASISVHGVKQNALGEIYIIGAENQFSSLPEDTLKLFLFKLDPDGSLLWNITKPISNSYTYSKLIPAQDGGCIYSNFSGLITINGVSTINKVSMAGQLIWSDTTNYAIEHIQENSNGDIFICGGEYNSTSNITVTTLEKRNALGQILWTKNLNILFQNTPIVLGLVLADNEDVLAIEQEYNYNNQTSTSYFIRFDTDGNLLWKRSYSFLPEQWGINISGSIATPDNGFLICAPLPQTSNFSVLKMDANGNVYPGQLSGQLALDANVNCLTDSSEQTLANWKVQLQSPDYALYTTTDSSGHYEMQDVPGDDYLLSAVTSSNLWESCLGEVAVAIPDTGTLALTQDLPIQIVAECPFMTLDIATPLLRRCFSNTYRVHYCNNGTIAADSAYVQIILDPLLNFNTASLPYIQNGDTLHFSLGSVPSLECGAFNFTVTVDCDSAQLGQTLCVSARIFPDSLCNPSANWTGALLEGSGYCTGDSVRFQLRNIGLAPTSSGLDFIIADDHVIMLQQPLPNLLPNDTYAVALPADGSTWRLVADQEPNAPGMEMPSIGVEGCGTSGPPSWGFFLQFANRDGNPFTDQDCHEVVGSYDPNDKQAFPIGLDSQHFIEQNTPLDYQIRFQNTGTDTAFTVVVKDTLSAWLDPATVRPGAASHPYTWALSGAGILTFTFNNILLPDSNVNEVASHGFIQFSIDQRPDNPFGVLLENRAGIYFDFNAPIMTNTVWHTISPDFKPTPTHEPKAPVSILQAWPNPAGQVTRIWTEKPFKAGQQLVLRNAMGSVVREIVVQGQTVEVQRAGLAAGLYFVELRSAGRVLAVGKVVWE